MSALLDEVMAGRAFGNLEISEMSDVACEIMETFNKARERTDALIKGNRD